MTQLHLIQDWAVWGAGASFWVCFTWPVVVRLFWPWYHHAWGWNMVIKTELIALALLADVLVTEFGVQPGFPVLWTEVAAVTLIPIVVAWRTVLIWKGQITGTGKDPAVAKPGDDS